MRGSDNYGVSEVVGLVTIVMIATTAIGVVIFWGVPTMESRKVSVRVDSALKQFKDLNDIIKKVSSEGVNKSEIFYFVTDAGDVYFEDNERFVFYYSVISGFDFTVGGLGDGDDNRFTLSLSGGAPDKLDIYHLNEDFPDEIGIGIAATIISNDPVSGAVRIDIYDNNMIYGSIWLFDTSCISYHLDTASGAYSVNAENSGVVHVSNNGFGFLYDEPDIYYKDDLLVMHVTCLKSQGYLGGSGPGKYKFTIKSNISSVQENRITVPRYFKMIIYGDESIVNAWNDYYMDEYRFTKLGDVLSLNGPLDFTLVYSICDVWLG